MINQVLMDAVKNRRSVYAIGKKPPLSDAQIRALIEHALTYAPSAFNSQSGRVLLLTGVEHNKLWSSTKEILRGIVPANRFATTEQKIDGFAAGYGTVLFFEDQSVVEGLQKDFPLYRDSFPVWSLQSSGMLQYVVWTLLESADCGANLQHYNPLIDGFVQKTWGIESNWKLLAQMPFGNVVEPADEKEHQPLETRLVVFG